MIYLIFSDLHSNLESLEKFFGRIEAIWKPVAAEEAFEIVRRRLFGKDLDDNLKVCPKLR